MLQPSPPLSLHFRLGAFPVVVEPTFWIVPLLFGFGYDQPLRLTLAWIAVLFASVLLHELGHATAAAAFGAGAAIRLHAFGGLCYSDRQLGRWQDVVMSLAGPFAGFLFGGVMWWVMRQWPPETPFGGQVFGMLLWVNFGYGMLNLLPVPPLDGGQAMVQILGPRRRRLALAIGMLFAAVGAALTYSLLGSLFFPLMLLVFGARLLGAWKETRDLRPVKAAPKEKDALARGWTALRAGEEREASRLAHAAFSQARGPQETNAARELLAWVALAEGNPRAAVSQLERMEPADAGRALTWALALEALGLADRALPHARRALEQERSDSAASLLVRLLLAQGRAAEAEAVAQAFPWRRTGQRDAHLSEAAAARGEHATAARLAAAAFSDGGRAEDAFRAAVGHAHGGEVERACEWLLRALEAGWDDREALAREPALAPVLARPELSARLAQA